MYLYLDNSFFLVLLFSLHICTTVYLVKSPTKGYPGCFWFKTIINKATINTNMQVFVQIWVSNSFGSIPKSTIKGCYGKSIFSFIRNCLSSKVLHHFVFPPAVNKSSYCSTFLPAFSALRVFYFSHSESLALDGKAIVQVMIFVHT